MHLTEHAQGHNVPAIILSFPGETDNSAAIIAEIERRTLG